MVRRFLFLLGTPKSLDLFLPKLVFFNLTFSLLKCYIYGMNEEFYIPDCDLTVPVVKEWPAQLVFELALGIESSDVLCTRYDITPLEFYTLTKNPVFQRDLSIQQAKLQEEGLSFKIKARLQAEDYLKEIDNIIHSCESSQEVKLAAISRVVEWGGLTPKQQPEAAKATVTINITKFSDSIESPAPPITIN